MCALVRVWVCRLATRTPTPTPTDSRPDVLYRAIDFFYSLLFSPDAWLPGVRTESWCDKLVSWSWSIDSEILKPSVWVRVIFGIPRLASLWDFGHFPKSPFALEDAVTHAAHHTHVPAFAPAAKGESGFGACYGTTLLQAGGFYLHTLNQQRLRWWWRRFGGSRLFFFFLTSVRRKSPPVRLFGQFFLAARASWIEFKFYGNRITIRGSEKPRRRKK